MSFSLRSILPALVMGLVTAIAALGMKTSFKELAVVGWRPVALVVAETAWIAALVLGSLFFVI